MRITSLVLCFSQLLVPLPTSAASVGLNASLAVVDLAAHPDLEFHSLLIARSQDRL